MTSNTILTTFLSVEEQKNILKRIDDPLLVFNTDLNRLECYWRYVDDINDEAILYRCYITDGVHWGDKAISQIANKCSKHDYVSPIILYEITL